MEEKYRIFKEEFNCILDLIDRYDKSFLSVYKNVVDKLYIKAVNSIPEEDREEFIRRCKDEDQFNVSLSNYQLEYMYLDSCCYLDVVRMKPFFKADVSIQAINDENIAYLNLFGLSMRNMEVSEPRLEIHYFQDESGNLTLVHSNLNEDKNAINFDFIVDLMFENNNYYLLLKKWHRGAELYCKQIEIKQEEVWDCIDLYAEACEEDVGEDDFDYTEEDFDGYDYE